jgi:predicted transcriptional regulator of viral defense system
VDCTQLPHPIKNQHVFLVANHLQKASYVSLQSALSYYGLIPEVVNFTTSGSTDHPETLETPSGIYNFRHLKSDLLFGYRMTKLGDQSVFVVTREKEILDLIHMQPSGDSFDYLRELRLQNTEILKFFFILREFAEKFNIPNLQKSVKEILQLITGESKEFEDL